MLVEDKTAGTIADGLVSAELASERFVDAWPAAGPITDLVKIAIIDRRALGREALTQALASIDGRFSSQAHADIGEWESSADRNDTSLIILEIDTVGILPSLEDVLQHLVDTHPAIPVVVIGENEDPRHIVGILARGARGYIPTSVGLRVAIGALCLAMAGGVFVPASALGNSGPQRPGPQQSAHSLFGLSERQAAVADAVALGKPNKIIAYELELCESTVKVHIRTIMKKLRARNRTEVAFKLHAAVSNSHSF